MWAATSCLGAWRPFIRGAAARFAPFHLQQLGLERETRERKCRFEFLVIGKDRLLRRNTKRKSVLCPHP
uniref:Uncharacterized protein n=1 Tax=Vitis vinifera TaxID=29760 RepID=F6HRJ9_VITVI